LIVEQRSNRVLHHWVAFQNQQHAVQRKIRGCNPYVEDRPGEGMRIARERDEDGVIDRAGDQRPAHLLRICVSREKQN